MDIVFAFIDWFALPVLAVGAAMWGTHQLTRGNRAIGAGAIAATAVLGLSATANAVGFGPWVEGGWAMWTVAVTGAYAVGSAVAARVSGARGASRPAALIALAATLVAGVAVRSYDMVDVKEAVKHAPPQDAQQILEMASREAWRPVELAAALGCVVGLLLLRRRDPPERLEQGDRFSERVG